jgi:hypothetical protein
MKWEQRRGDTTGNVPSGSNSPSQKKRSDLRDYCRAIGPGLTAGASDDDPSGIATYAQSGSKDGLTFSVGRCICLHTDGGRGDPSA